MTPTTVEQILLLVAVVAIAVLAIELSIYALWRWWDQWFLLPAACLGGGIFALVANQFILNTTGILSGAGVGLLLALFSRFICRGHMRFATMMLAPAMVAVAVVMIFPFLFEVRLSFSQLNMYSLGQWIRTGELGWVGLENYINVFTTAPLQTATFVQLFIRTIYWTLINVFFHVILGLGLALLLNQPIRGKGIYRTLLVIPWAMPQVVAILAWRGEFHPQFGFVNQLMRFVGMEGLNWWSDPIPVFASCCIVNIWLGIPFMTIVFLGGLQSIPKSVYEAACIDGATVWQQFRYVTLPLLQPVVVPSVTLGTIWTFNNINVIYLMTGQNGGTEYADILVSALYKSAFTYSRYGFSAAFSMVIFLILIAITGMWIKLSRATESAVL